MTYLPELYYFNNKDFPTKKAVLITAIKVGQWCNWYKVKLISPVKGVKETERKGMLPVEKSEREKFIEGLVNWIFLNSAYIKDLFSLFLDNEPLEAKNHEPAKFDHHDDTCCWVLNLSEEEFRELKNQWKKENLPEDLFYKSGQEKHLKPKSNGLISRFLIKLGFSKIYTPKQWEEKSKFK